MFGSTTMRQSVKAVLGSLLETLTDGGNPIVI